MKTHDQFRYSSDYSAPLLPHLPPTSKIHRRILASRRLLLFGFALESFLGVDYRDVCLFYVVRPIRLCRMDCASAVALCRAAHPFTSPFKQDGEQPGLCLHFEHPSGLRLSRSAAERSWIDLMVFGASLPLPAGFFDAWPRQSVRKCARTFTHHKLQLHSRDHMQIGPRLKTNGDVNNENKIGATYHAKT